VVFPKPSCINIQYEYTTNTDIDDDDGDDDDDDAGFVASSRPTTTWVRRVGRPMGAAMTTTTTTGEEGKGDDDVDAREEQQKREDSTEEPTTTTTTTTSGDEEKEDEEEEECGFCKYMKGGSCKDAFVAWEACVDEAKEKEEDFVERCFETTSALRDCMLKDPEYYGPMVGENEGSGEDGDDEKEEEA